MRSFLSVCVRAGSPRSLVGAALAGALLLLSSSSASADRVRVQLTPTPTPVQRTPQPSPSPTPASSGSVQVQRSDSNAAPSFPSPTPRQPRFRQQLQQDPTPTAVPPTPTPLPVTPTPRPAVSTPTPLAPSPTPRRTTEASTPTAVSPTPTRDPLTRGAARIGFVDIELVLDSSQAIRTIVGEADAELGQVDRKIQEKRRELRQLRTSLETQSSVLSDAERQRRQQQAVDLLNEIDDMEYRFQRTIREKQRSTIEPLLEKVIDVIGDVGRRDGYDLVVRGEVVLWGRETVDLTPLVVRECDLRIDELRRAVQGSGTFKPAASGTAPRPTQPAPLPLIP